MEFQQDDFQKENESVDEMSQKSSLGKTVKPKYHTA